jgi:hypothetical protein
MKHRQGIVTRRDFVRGTLAAAIGASTAGVALGAAQPRPKRQARVTIVRDEKATDARRTVDRQVLRAMLATTLTGVTGQKTLADAWRSLVTPRDVVGLVPTDHLNPTHQELIDVVRETLGEAGVPADRIVIAQGGPERAASATALIALPALKAHWLTGIGTVMKNYIVFSGRPSAYHDAGSAKLGEIWLRPEVKGKTKLVLVDALRPLCDKGPQPDPRYMWDYKGLIAGTDPVATEAVCLKIIGAKRDALRREPWPLSPPPLCVAAADNVYGLGTSRLDEIAIDARGWTADLLI